ncbi:MAG: hypothetical protein U0872_07520 [Planctomycetaceae bacterium]
MPAALDEKTIPPASSAIWCALIVLGIALKIGLLCTSQTLPDGDEAVEGLMAMHILERGVHPVYPYGVNYGAGAGWEAHVAAGLFGLFGVSEVALKSVGLMHYLATLGLVGALAYFWRGGNGALVAAGLYALAPQTAQWALKCAGGHQVAVILALGGWLCVLRGWTIPALVALPLAVLAHPIALPFVAVVCAGWLVQSPSWRRRGLVLIGLAAVAAAEFWLLRPPGETVWNPLSKSFDLPARLLAIPRLAVGLFTPNLNSLQWPAEWDGVIALVWLAAVVWAVRQPAQPWWNRAVLLAPWGIVFVVSSSELAPRHLLLASPVAAIVLACAQDRSRTWTRTLPFVLAGLGGLVHVAEMADPCIYGPGVQSAGVVRANVSSVMENLRTQQIKFVYCVDPMLQWNIDFASREQIRARWLSAHDRLPEYVRAVDEARRQGQRVALVTPGGPGIPVQFLVTPDPPEQVINQYFQPAPAISP